MISPEDLGIADGIIAYESGELPEHDIPALFQELANTGIIWKLQGSYQRTAVKLHDAGLIRLERYV